MIVLLCLNLSLCFINLPNLLIDKSFTICLLHPLFNQHDDAEHCDFLRHFSIHNHLQAFCNTAALVLTSNIDFCLFPTRKPLATLFVLSSSKSRSQKCILHVQTALLVRILSITHLILQKWPTIRIIPHFSSRRTVRIPTNNTLVLPCPLELFVLVES